MAQWGERTDRAPPSPPPFYPALSVVRCNALPFPRKIMHKRAEPLIIQEMAAATLRSFFNTKVEHRKLHHFVYNQEKKTVGFRNIKFGPMLRNILIFNHVSINFRQMPSSYNMCFVCKLRKTPQKIDCFCLKFDDKCKC